MPSSSQHRYRPRVTVPRATAEKLTEGGGPGLPTGSTLIYGWLVRAAQYAREGRTELLPRESSAPSDRAPAFFSMSTDELAEVGDLLRDAGSSVRAVVVACVDAWAAADYSAVRMEWPVREGAEAAGASRAA